MRVVVGYDCCANHDYHRVSSSDVDVDDGRVGQFRGQVDFILFRGVIQNFSESTCFRCGNNFGHHHHANARRKRKGIAYAIELKYLKRVCASRRVHNNYN